MKKINYTAEFVVTLKEIVVGGYILWGYIYNDKKKRFSNGSTIHTSLVTKETKGFIYTLNSIYRKVEEKDISKPAVFNVPHFDDF